MVSLQELVAIEVDGNQGRYRSRFVVHNITHKHPKVQNSKTKKERQYQPGKVKKDEQVLIEYELYCKDYSNELSNNYV